MGFPTSFVMDLQAESEQCSFSILRVIIVPCSFAFPEGIRKLTKVSAARDEPRYELEIKAHVLHCGEGNDSVRVALILNVDVDSDTFASATDVQSLATICAGDKLVRFGN